MKFLIFLVLGLVSHNMANPIGQEQTVAVAQDTQGNYRVAYNIEGIQKIEQGNADGTVSGGYSYIDANGQVQNVQYTAGSDGFRASGTNFPVAPIDTNVPVQDTPEVAKAKAIHFANFPIF